MFIRSIRFALCILFCGTSLVLAEDKASTLVECAKRQSDPLSVAQCDPGDGGEKATAKLVQCALNNLGYKAGPVDGQIGKGTRRAISDFQLGNGFKVDSEIHKSQIDKMIRNICLRDHEIERMKLFGFGDPKIEDVTAEVYRQYKGSRDWTHGFNITLVMLRNAGWERNELVKRTADSLKNFSQCGVKYNRVKLYEVTSTTRFGVDMKPDKQNELAKTIPAWPKPTVFYIRSNPGGNIAQSVIPNRTPIDDSIYNVWITRGVAENPGYFRAYKTYKWGEFTPEGHEITHILLKAPDSEHFTGAEKNLFHEDYKLFSGHLNAEQCERIRTDWREAGFVKPL